MKEKRINFKNIVQNQLPSYVKEEFPLIVEFLKQYYISQEFQGAPTDLIQNIDQYIKLDSIKDQVDFVVLNSDISFFDEVIPIDINESKGGTKGFPDSYGLLKIDDEIITYTGITTNSFTGCIRGFSGITTYTNDQEQLVFKSTESSDHSKGSKVINLNSLFLKNFFKKIKYQFSPGFENRELNEDLDENLFIKQSKDFYSTRGTDSSFKILFKSLYGEDVSVVKPQSYLFKPSDAQYQLSNVMVVERISGNPYELENATLFQDEYEGITKGYAPISKVESISGNKFYKLYFDAGYNKDITYDGSLYGSFSIHPKTKLIGSIESESDVITVDSTIGFPNKGTLYVTYEDNTTGLVKYNSKNINQFLQCENITKKVSDGSDIYMNIFARGKSNKNMGEDILVRVTSIINGIDVVEDSYYQNSTNKAIIKTLGVPVDDIKSNNWIFNISNGVDISLITVKSTNVYTVFSKENHFLRTGDSISIIANDGTKDELIVTKITSNKEIDVQGVITDFNTNKKYKFKRNILRSESTTYANLSKYVANVQNVYKQKEKTLVASLSLPYYRSYPLNPSNKSFLFSIVANEGETVQSFTINNHNFYTGDAVYFTPGLGEGFDNLFTEGLYFVKKINDNVIQLAKSKFDIYQNINLVSVEGPVNITSNKIEYYNFRKKTLNPQNILREINDPINDENEYLTGSDFTGILINGVEILSYKSKDKIYYGPLEEINVLSNGYDYDVINPPSLIISDSTGIGATGYCALSGSLQEIRIVDPGFDYLDIPEITISGGNGSGAKAKAVMKKIDHEVVFNSSTNINLSNNTIGFSTFHKFRNYEKIIYKTNGENGIGGITTNSSYYISIIDEFTVKLHKTLNDALTGINTIPLTSYGQGDHLLKTYEKKSIIWSINVENSGSNYENKKRVIKSSGISTFFDQISIKNHDFNSGEIITYSTTGTSIGGLTNNDDYYITKIDEDNFKLSLVGIGSTNKDLYYKNKEYINLTSGGSGTHIFNYPEISVNVVGNTGVFLPNNNNFEASIQPIFRGEITSVCLEEGGVGYGSSDILNYYKDPLITLSTGNNAIITPIISDGKIVNVSINNPGKDYYSIPDIVVGTNGNGIGAVLTPVIENNQITSIKVIESGFGYDKNTTITAISPGLDAKFKAKIKSWTINRFKKNFKDIGLDDGIVHYSSNSKYELQYCHLYSPRRLREMIGDLQVSSGVEVSSTNHSPIIGWGYDGNPIYGPYGYENIDGTGSIVRMKSGYILDIQSNRPPFPEGFFIEDYVHLHQDDEDILDEFNGRFCITPEFPNGVYAYFSTIEQTTSGNFDNYRLPTFPYFIGNKFKSKPNDFNFKRSSNQDEIDLNSTDWIKNTTYYQFLKENTSYDYLFFPNKLEQTFSIKNVLPGSIENVSIISGGSYYKVNDKVITDDEGTQGYGFLAEVSKIGGKKINNIIGITSEISNVKIYPGNSNIEYIIETEVPHNFLNKDTITLSGLNTTSTLLEGSYEIKVDSNNFTVADILGIGSTSITGIVTYFTIAGDLNSDLKNNDILLVGEEKIKVLNVDKRSSRIRVLREIDGTVGLAHSYNDIIYKIPRRFSIYKEKFQSPFYKKNKDIYFNPKESLGVGNSFGVGIGTTLTFSNPGVGQTQVFIPTKTIYLPGHNLETGDSLTYFTNYENNGLGGIKISDNGISSRTLSDQSTLYVARVSNDLIGISTVKVGLSTNGLFLGITSTTKNISTLYFTGIGSGTYHSFKTNYPQLTGEISRNVAIVSLGETHGLTNNDTVFVNVNPGISKTYTIKYNDYNRRLLVNPRSFDASDVNITDNTIKIENHDFKNGQKILYTSNSPIGGLINNNLYYVFVYNKDTVKLTKSYSDAVNLNPNTISFTSVSSGVLSLVNPPIKSYKGSILDFDLSDSSLSYTKDSVKYPAFEFNFYFDSNFTQKFYKSKSSLSFDVEKTGIIGIDTNAKVSINVNSDTPDTLFYRLDPIYNNNYIPNEKKEIIVDDEVYLNNQIEINLSRYSGEYKIVSLSSTSFSYNMNGSPENLLYDSSLSSLDYETNSLSGFGSITKVRIIDNGKNYYSIPTLSKIESKEGSESILEFSSKSIGKIQKNVINDIGFDFPSDFTLRSNISFPQILKVEPLNSFDYIKITSKGYGYANPPKLVILDGKTKNVVPEVKFSYSLDDTFVTILENSYGISNTTPTIIPTQNTNGVGISTISYDFLFKDITVSLSQGFSLGEFPFEVGDKVLIENTLTNESTGVRGFNSSDYGYKLFTITSINDNPGGYGSITYNISNLLSSGESPGTYDYINSIGTVIPEKYFPTFETKLKSNNFYLKEKIRYRDEAKILGFVEDWNNKIKFLYTLSRDSLQTGKIIEGTSSKSQGLINEVYRTNAFSRYGAYSKVDTGWITETGVLNTNIQRLQDSFYYQNFSYSLKSRVPYQTWENAVSTLNHTAGFRKFADYQCESVGIGSTIIYNPFFGNDYAVVNLTDNTIIIPGHQFITGEEIEYTPNHAIGIVTENFGTGIGTTDLLPTKVYAIRVDESKIKLAKNSGNALKKPPEELIFTSVGIGTRHRFTSVFNNNRIVLSEVDSVSDITGVVDLNVTNNFDLVVENSSKINEDLISNKITLSNVELLDYFESVGNRVLSMDNINTSFEENKTDFVLTSNSYPIFERTVDCSNPSTVNITNNVITIPNHYFVTGEEVIYSAGGISTNAIGITTTDFGVGIGSTDLLPSTVYVIKVNDSQIKLAKDAQNALKTTPEELEFVSVGIGTSHTFTSTNQNSRVIITIDNVIQSPIVATSSTTGLSTNVSFNSDTLYLNSTSNFFANDFIKIGNEIMKISSVGIGSTVKVYRSLMGTQSVGYSTGQQVTKINGNYNIVGSTLYFAESPYSKVPLSTTTNPPSEQDWDIVSRSSSFYGRVFAKSGVGNSTDSTYSKNRVIDDISDDFDGKKSTFTLKQSGVNTSGISSESIILINGVFQTPGDKNSYTLSESVGVTSITFIGAGTSLPSDVNTSNLPIGKVILSVGSTEGLGYQPLVCAGGTAIISGFGTISSISIGNSGSGYRTSIQTFSGISSVVVRVGVSTVSTGTPKIEFIGTASVNNGRIVSIAITNPGIGYTSSNPPKVFIDDPIPYSDVPLVYSSSSTPGIGSQATVDIIVGQGSSVIDFEIKNNGYGYKIGEILTLPIGGTAGIPTVTGASFKEFNLTINNVFTDKFNGWVLGEFQLFDSIESLFDGERKIFPLLLSGQSISVNSKKGSNIIIKNTLLIFLNGVLQNPDTGYIFNGGSRFEFTEAPSSGDECSILFYKGNSAVDVSFTNIPETIKNGDDLILGKSLSDPLIFAENPRSILNIESIDTVETVKYFGPENTSDETLERTLSWKKQTEDRILNNLIVTKDRVLYEPIINPTTYLIQNIGVSTNIIFVESIRPFFNAINEYNASLDFQKKITILSQDSVVSASATAIVSIAGTISSIKIIDGGVGYTTSPNVTISNPVGIGTTRQTATSTINAGIGSVNSISLTGIVSNYSQSDPPMVLIDPPSFKYETNNVVSYSGDFGIITGIAKTSIIGIALTGITFDFAIPLDSHLRNGSVTDPTLVSGIQTGYYFTISRSNVGNGLTALNSSGSIVGTSKSYIDGVYQVAKVSIAQTSAPGLGVTFVAKVTVSVSSYNGLSGIGFSNYYGDYSWGRIVLENRSKSNSYNAYTNDGYSGISTGTMIIRSNSLKYKNA